MATDYRIKNLIVKSLHHYRQRYIHQNAGFSLLEMMVVLLMIGILSAIAAPSWLALISQQRLNKANDRVVSVIQQTQSEAKRTKRTYSVSFRVNTTTNIPEYMIYQGTTLPSSGWISLSDSTSLKSRDVFLYTNLIPPSPTDNNHNTITADKQIVQTPTETGTITFDSQGILANKISGLVTDTPLAIMVAVPLSTGDTANSGQQRCVIIQSLIGGIRTAKDSSCKTLYTGS
jgi:prepilin-type N-terminal cleavage/methylation domain-containing protein